MPLSIGLRLILAINETRYYRSRKPEDAAATKFWVKVFTATFAIGVATGITMEFSFGTNWANYSRFVGDIFGAPLAAEALFAFFPGVDFSGCAPVRARAGEPEVLHGVLVARVGRVVPIGAVDPHRELLDADAGRRGA